MKIKTKMLLILIFILIFNLIKCYSSLTNGLVAYWNFDHATYWKDPVYGGEPTVIGSGTPSRDTSVKKFGDGSLYVDGSSHLKIVNVGSWLPIGNSHYTISLWFRATSFVRTGLPTANGPGFVAWGTSGQGFKWVGFRISNNAGGLLENGWGDDLDCSPTTCVLSLNTWYHAVATYDGATKKIYLNGELKASRAASGKITTSVQFLIGKTVSLEFLTGWIDDLYIYNRALSLSEIQSLYSSPIIVQTASTQLQNMSTLSNNSFSGTRFDKKKKKVKDFLFIDL